MKPGGMPPMPGTIAPLTMGMKPGGSIIEPGAPPPAAAIMRGMAKKGGWPPPPPVPPDGMKKVPGGMPGGMDMGSGMRGAIGAATVDVGADAWGVDGDGDGDDDPPLTGAGAMRGIICGAAAVAPSGIGAPGSMYMVMPAGMGAPGGNGKSAGPCCVSIDVNN